MTHNTARPIRWVPSVKLKLLRALDAGALSLDEACRRYDTSPEEIARWRALYAVYGQPGLRSTRTQIYPKPPPR